MDFEIRDRSVNRGETGSVWKRADTKRVHKSQNGRTAGVGQTSPRVGSSS
ncbi:MAG: hypothetical protein JWN00_5795 [Actinomycetia bacterium]|nr:hypothetical protein [Actinomycetes bacterium]